MKKRLYQRTALLFSMALCILSMQGIFAQGGPFALCDIPSSFYLTLPNGYRVSANHPSGVWSDTYLLIPANAVVTFDRNVKMTRCTIRMESNARIVVEKGIINGSSVSSTLTTEVNTVFFGCTAMWNGIEIGTGCGYNMSNTEFRNSVNGLVMQPGNLSAVSNSTNTCRIESCTFRNNRICITAEDAAPTGNLSFIPRKFVNNTFVSNGPLLSGSGAFAAISFRNCKLAKVVEANTFDGTGSGLRCDNSTLLVQNGTYRHMTGHGIYALQSHLTIFKANFDDVWDMIESEAGKSLIVRNCTLRDGVHQGIYAHKNAINSPSISIVGNDLEFQEVPAFAIKLERSPGSDATKTQNRIDNNEIKISGAHRRDCMIIDIDPMNGGEDNFPITRCTLTVDADLDAHHLSSDGPFVCHGIHIQAPSTVINSGILVGGNTLHYSSGHNLDGQDSPNLGIVMEFVKGKRNEIVGNGIFSRLFFGILSTGEDASWMKCGIHVDESPNLDICDNTGDDLHRLFHLSGALGYCDFAINNMSQTTCWYGLHCKKQPGSANTTFGAAQLWHQNTWSTTPIQYMLRSASNDDFSGGVSSNNQFVVDPSIPGNMAPGLTSVPPRVSPSNLFFNQPTGVDNSDCLSGDAPPDPERPPLSGWEDDVIGGTYPYESASQAWDMRRDLLSDLMRYPALRAPGSPLQIWYDNQVGSSPWHYARFEQLYSDAFQLTATLQTTLDNARDLSLLRVEELAYLDSLQNADLATEDTTVLQQQWDKAAELIIAQNDLAVQTAQAYGARQAALNAAETQYDALPHVEVWENNRRTYYNLMLQQARGIVLSSSDLVTVRSIANQCPLQGGLVVRQIPQLLPVSEAYQYTREDYWVGCVDSVQNRQQSSTTSPTAPDVMLYPNPADQNVTLFFAQAADAATWAIHDIAGRLWKSGQVPQGQFSLSIPTADLPKGIYFCSVNSRQGQIATLKVAIQH